MHACGNESKANFEFSLAKLNLSDARPEGWAAVFVSETVRLMRLVDASICSLDDVLNVTFEMLLEHIEHGLASMDEAAARERLKQITPPRDLLWARACSSTTKPTCGPSLAASGSALPN